jgi:hypothetical protein
MATAAVIGAIIAQALANAGQIGAGVSDLFGAKGIMSDEEEQALRELKRRQEMEALGLTAEERKSLQLDTLAPVQAAMREARESRFDVLGAQGVGAADVARALQGEQQREARALAQGSAEIARQDVAERKREEEQLLALSQKQAAEEAARAQAWTKIVVSFLGAGRQMEEAMGQARADQEQIGAVEGMPSGENIDYGEAASFFSQFYGG